MAIVLISFNNIYLIVTVGAVRCAIYYTIAAVISKALVIAYSNCPYSTLPGSVKWIIVGDPLIVCSGITIGHKVESQNFPFVMITILRIIYTVLIGKLTGPHISLCVKKIVGSAYCSCYYPL